MTLNEPPILPTDPQPQPRSAVTNSAARRRRARRAQLIPDAEGRAEVMASLAKRAYPNYEFFLFAVISGAVLGLGYLLDSPAVLLLGVLLAPLMTPWVGMVLAIITGSVRFFVETLAALLISVLLIFLSGLMSGLASRPFLPLTLNNAFMNGQIWYPSLAVLALGAILLVVSFVRSEEKPFLPSVMLAYSLLTPISAAGFGLGSGVEGLWPKGALVFVVNFALATLLGLLTFLAFRFRPSQLGWAMSGGGAIFLGLVVALLMVPGLGSRPAATAPTSTPTRTKIAATATSQLVLAPTSTASPKPTLTPRVQTATPTVVPLTLEVTLPPTETATITLTVEPTPVYAKISSDSGGGVNLRKSPNGTYIATLDNGSMVIVLPDVQEVSNVMWAHVLATKNGRQLEGWILQSVLSTATPVPNWEPSATPASGDTETPTVTLEATVAP